MDDVATDQDTVDLLLLHLIDELCEDLTILVMSTEASPVNVRDVSNLYLTQRIDPDEIVEMRK